MTEILAPVGGKEQLIAAVRSGANAVYLGAKNFNARRNASNFEDFELPEIVSYCHARNVKVHVVLNTLVMDSEIPALMEEIRKISAFFMYGYGFDFSPHRTITSSRLLSFI